MSPFFASLAPPGLDSVDFESDSLFSVADCSLGCWDVDWYLLGAARREGEAGAMRGRIAAREASGCLVALAERKMAVGVILGIVVDG